MGLMKVGATLWRLSFWWLVFKKTCIYGVFIGVLNWRCCWFLSSCKLPWGNSFQKVSIYLQINILPFLQVRKVRLFQDEEIYSDLYLTVCEWPSDSSKVIVFGFKYVSLNEIWLESYMSGSTPEYPMLPWKHLLKAFWTILFYTLSYQLCSRHLLSACLMCSGWDVPWLDFVVL